LINGVRNLKSFLEAWQAKDGFPHGIPRLSDEAVRLGSRRNPFAVHQNIAKILQTPYQKP